ncbi:dachshund homolog 2 isoform X9 [Culex quinquefasciatus]|nr:dachshund homolog 2 isoform X9 [Culex quinquefasciatus]
MDSAMDSASTASDHSVASSNDSRGRNLSSPAMPHTHNGGGHTMDKTRTPTPGSPPMDSRQHHNNGSHGGSDRGPVSMNHRDMSGGRQMASSPLGATPQQMMGMPHPLSPPHVSTPSAMAMVGMPPRMAGNLSHIPPHGLGLLNSFMHHASPLDLMAAAHHHVPPRSYNSPPPISSSDPTANECKLVDYRGHKVAAFMIQGDTMLCLPQAFELFLKHLVGGLHTVYTKLKRLDIVPLVCNVEQVRILRGLGAIQPGVNRCKLLSCKDFDVLYRDCTTARCLSIKPPESSRPGRPPKRGPVGLSMPASSHMSHHAAAAAVAASQAAAAQQIKKHRLDNGEFVYENGHLNDLRGLDKSPLLANGYNAPPTHLNHIPFMQMNPHPGGGHPLMSPGVNPHGIPRPDGSIIKGQNIGEAIARAAYEDIVKHLERLREERGEERLASLDQKPRDLSSLSAPPPDSPNGASPVLNLSKSGGDQASGGAPSERSNQNSPEPSVHEEDENISEANISDTEDGGHNEKEEDISDCERDISSPVPATVPVSQEMHGNRDQQQQQQQQAALNYTSLAAASAAAAVAVGGGVPSAQDPSQVHSSTETLLRNIQGLLKVAADNARQQERQTSYEKAELKMDVIREREVKDSLERQLADEKRLRGLFQKRFKKERRLRVQLKDRLDSERKRRTQLEEIIKASGTPTEALRIIAENISVDQQREKEREREAEREKEREKEREREKHREGKLGREDRNNSDSDRMRTTPDRSRTAEHGGGESREHRDRGERGSSAERFSKEGSPVHSSSRGASQEVSPPQPHHIPEGGKGWNYPGLDIMATGAFWQNYSESLAQELELERKVRQQAAEGEVKGPLQDRSNYYKNSVLYSSAT